MSLSRPTPAPEGAVAWAASVLGGELVAVDGIQRGGEPWLVTAVSVSARPRQGILRLGEPEDSLERQRIATEGAALTMVNQRGLPAPELHQI